MSLKNTHWLEYAHQRLCQEGVVQEPFHVERRESSGEMNLDDMLLNNAPLLSKNDVQRRIGKNAEGEEIKIRFKDIAEKARKVQGPYPANRQQYQRKSDERSVKVTLEKYLFSFAEKGIRSEYRTLNCLDIKGREQEADRQKTILRVNVVTGKDLAYCSGMYWCPPQEKKSERGKTVHLSHALEEVLATLTPHPNEVFARAVDLKEQRETPQKYIDALIDFAKQCLPYWKILHAP